jgi:hypothetical protein
MKKFAAVLTKIDKVLSIPQPSRSRVILEISADMQDLYQHYIRQGLDEEQATNRTVEEFDLSAEEIAAIARVHDSSLGRFLDRFSARTRGRLERMALAITMVPVALVGYRLVLSGGMFQDSGIWIWPLLAGAIAGLALGVSKWYGLFVVKDHNIRAVRKRLNLVLYIALGQLGTGFVGMYISLYQTWVMSSVDRAMTIPYLAHWLQRSSALLSTAMIAALMSGLIWIVNSGKAVSVEQYESELIIKLEGGSK